MNWINQISTRVRSRSVDARIQAIEHAEEAVQELLDVVSSRIYVEKNELVLVTLLQFLQRVRYNEEMDGYLRDVASCDKRPLVRAAAIAALMVTENRDNIDFLVSRLLEERNPRVAIEILLSLFQAGFTSVFDEILRMIHSKEYHTQCAAINGVVDLELTKEQRSRVVEVLRSLENADTKAVSTTAQRALREMDGYEV